MTINYNEHDDVTLDYKPGALTQSEATLRQMLAFDIVPDAHLVGSPAGLGLHGCSQEVFDMEMTASQQRRNNIGPVMPLLGMLARITSEVLNAAILVRREEDPEVEPRSVDPRDIHAASVGILSALVDMGVAHLAHPGTGDTE